MRRKKVVFYFGQFTRSHITFPHTFQRRKSATPTADEVKQAKYWKNGKKIRLGLVQFLLSFDSHQSLQNCSLSRSKSIVLDTTLSLTLYHVCVSMNMFRVLTVTAYWSIEFPESQMITTITKRIIYFNSHIACSRWLSLTVVFSFFNSSISNCDFVNGTIRFIVIVHCTPNEICSTDSQRCKKK